MKYIIYQLVQPKHLKIIVKIIDEQGYYDKVVYRDVLEELDVPNVESEHNTMESAIEEIKNKCSKLENMRLTILPILSISYDGIVS